MHQYVKANSSNQDPQASNAKQALIDIYHVMLCSGLTYERYDTQLVPWTGQLVHVAQTSYAWFVRQKTIKIYLNDILVEKISMLKKKAGSISSDFKAFAISLIKTGENTWTVKTRHNWRWGMLIMMVNYQGFSFMLDGCQT